MLAVAVVALLPVLAFAGPASAEQLRELGLQPLKEGTRLVDFELKDLVGSSRKLSDFTGKVVFLNFWASWCGPCRAEMPSMQALYQKLKGKGLEIVAVNLQEDAAAVQRFVKAQGLSFPVLLDSSGRVGATYGARSIPTTYIIDRQGFVIAGTLGSREWNTPEYVSFFSELLEP
jgi:thiol-disulfide isomerase/thioredoxin